MRGLSAAMTYNVVLNGVRFSAFSALSTAPTLETVPTVANGFVAGYIAGYIAAPIAQARTIQQGEGGAARAGGRSQLSAGEALRLKPFAGASSWALRNAGHTAILFTLYERFQESLRATWPHAPNTALNLCASLQAATISCFVMNPVDLVATRLFHQASLRQEGPPRPLPHLHAPPAAQTQPVFYTSPLDCARKTMVAEGVGGFYRGLSANVVRIVPHTVITFLLIETMREHISRRREPSPVDGRHAPSRRLRAHCTELLLDREEEPIGPRPLLLAVLWLASIAD